MNKGIRNVSNNKNENKKYYSYNGSYISYDPVSLTEYYNGSSMNQKEK